MLLHEIFCSQFFEKDVYYNRKWANVRSFKGEFKRVMLKITPTWEKAAILISAFAAFIAALVAAYQGYMMRETVQISLAITRPFVVIEPVSQPDNLTKIVLQAKNTGSVPARILYASGKTWVDSTPFRTSIDSSLDHVLYQSQTVVFSEITPDSPEVILQGKQILRIGYCTLYESVSLDDTRRWVAESWFIFNPRNRKLEIRKRGETSVKQTISMCNIDRLIPEKWFESITPPWRDKENR